MIMANRNLYIEDFSEDLLESCSDEKIETVLDFLQEFKVTIATKAFINYAVLLIVYSVVKNILFYF